MAEANSGGDWLSDVGGFFGGLVKEGMAGYIEVEKAKASNAGNQAATQEQTFNSPTVDENPTAKGGQSVAGTSGVTLGNLTLPSQTGMYVAGGMLLLGAFMLLKRR